MSTGTAEKSATMRRGSTPERLVIDAKWKDAAKTAMAKGKPPASK